MNTSSKNSQTAVKAAIRRALALGVGAQMVAIPTAMAQQVADSGGAETMKKVVVTGSNIPTSDLVEAAPVDVITSDVLSRRGVASIEELTKQIPSNIGSGNYGVSQGNGGDGSSSVALRGIPGGTLVLINGRRSPKNFGTEDVDLNGIPLAAIERIEILKDGGSAIYGADAIAGVVNIITRKNFNGAEMDAYYGNTTSSDVGTQKYSFITGISNEKTSVLIGGSYYKANALYSVDRERSFPDVTDPNNTSGTSNPGRLRTSAANNPGATIPAGGYVYRGAPGTTGTSAANYSAYSALTDRFPFPLYTPAIRPSERYSVFGTGEHKLFDDNLVFFTEASYSRTWSYNQFAPTPIVFQQLNTATSPNGMVIPASNPYNPFGVPMSTVQYRVVELGPRTENQDANIFRFVTGLKGQIAESSWNWEVAMMFGRDERVETLGGELSRAALEKAINSTDRATAFNPFGNRANGPSQLNAVSQSLVTLRGYDIWSVDGKVTGELFDLPGGPVAMALGGEHREEKGSERPDGPTVFGDTVGFTSGTATFGNRKVDSVFGELAVPITGPDMDIPVLHSLKATAAFRHDSYSDFGGTTNPKVGLRWQPLDNTLTLRASYSESFRAPSFADLYTQSQESFPELRNPVKQAAGAPEYFEQIRTFYKGNPNLKPETADNYTAGFVYSPPYVKGLTVSADWFQINQKNVAGSVDQYIIDQNFAGGGPGNPNAPFASNINFDAATSTYLSLTAPTLNLSTRIIEGIDAQVTYELPTESCGTFTLNGFMAFFTRFEQEDIPGSGLRDRLGDFVDPSQGFGLGSIPRFKGTFSAFWGFKDVEVGLTANYINSYRDDVAAGFDRSIDDIVTFDLQASYKLPWDAKVTVGVINVADTQPPLAGGAFADKYDRDTHDLRQRFVYASVNKKF